MLFYDREGETEKERERERALSSKCYSIAICRFYILFSCCGILVICPAAEKYKEFKNRVFNLLLYNRVGVRERERARGEIDREIIKDRQIRRERDLIER